jgi:hypothetical protein
MRVEFPQGVPEECTQWLRENVGIGNIKESRNGTPRRIIDMPEYDWFYERIDKTSDIETEIRFVPTITVKDPKLAILFALRWS